jgi:hypothetical protein
MKRTGTFKISAELKQDLWVAKYFEWDGVTPPCGFVKLKNPGTYDIDEEIEALKADAINSIVGNGNLISITSERKSGIENFIPYEEFTVTYEY